MPAAAIETRTSTAHSIAKSSVHFVGVASVAAPLKCRRLRAALRAAPQAQRPTTTPPPPPPTKAVLPTKNRPTPPPLPHPNPRVLWGGDTSRTSVLSALRLR